MASREYWPQLDGIRALAVSAVVAYHLGDLPGGWLGVDVFFVLSGYLITTILLPDVRSAEGFKRFWGRRARRLMPAVLTLLLVMSAYAWLGGRSVVPAQLRAPGLATLFYGANWQQIVSGHGYFASYASPSPLQHTWSLAVEEQYYLAWPLVLGVVLLGTRARSALFQRRLLIGLTVTLAVTSAVWMGVAAHLFGPNRAYLGTDTRAWELLIGAAAALLWSPSSAGNASRIWSAMAPLGLAGAVVGVLLFGGPPAWVWDGGLEAVAVCALLLIVGSLRAPRGLVSGLLSLRPMRWVGAISYSLYIWHWPVIVTMTPGTTGLSGASLLIARLATMMFAACGSYYLIERPLRRADWKGWSKRLHVPTPGFASVAGACVAVAVVAGTVGPPAARSAQVALPPRAVPISAQEPALTLPESPPGAPYRVWMIGDSVMFDGSLGVAAALQSTGKVSVVQNSAFPGWGLTRVHDFAATAGQTIATYHPQIVIGTWSWDDPAAAASPAAYLQYLEQTMAALLRPGNGVQLVILMQFPQAGPLTEVDTTSGAQAWANQTQIQKDWDRVAQSAVAHFPGHALYLATSQLFAPGGRFYTWLKTPAGSWIRARKLDNTHFCPYGAAEWGALVTEDLTPILGLPDMKPGWETGSWTTDGRYNDPPGACPADQPPPGYDGVSVPGSVSTPSPGTISAEGSSASS